MSIERLLCRSASVTALFIAGLDASALAQSVAPTAAGPAPADPDSELEQIIELSPFEVSASEDQDRYRARSTLAGTRVRTDLRDVASAISVVTDQFLRDTSSTKSEELLVYTTNTEVGGLLGNYSGAGGSATYNEAPNLLRPASNTRVRGLDSADNTRDYFLTEIPWDGYNVDRVDMQRGPNSILFGVGSPAGIINTSLNGASFTNSGVIENRVDHRGSLRTSLDVNRTLLDDRLAVRVAALEDKTVYRQKPAFNRDQRLYGALRFEPRLFGNSARTSLTAKYEKGKVDANRPRTLPPIDAITPWFLTGSSNGFPNLNRMTLDPRTTWYIYGANTLNPPGYPNQTYPWFREAFMGRLMSSNIASFYDADNAAPLRTMMPNIGTGLGLGSNGVVDGTIQGVIFQRPWGISTFNKYARGVIPGGKYYSDTSLADPSIFDFHDVLIDGDNKYEWQDWESADFALSQTFFNNRLGFEFVYDYQLYRDGQVAFLSQDQYQISVDINTHLLDGTENPNVGRPYVGNSGQYGNNRAGIQRNNMRFTATGELRAEDFFGESSFLSDLLGRHIFTGVASEDLKRTDDRGFSRWASEPAYTDATGGIGDITNGARQFDWIAYLGPDLRGRTSAAGIDLENVSARIQPSPYENVRFFDSHWNAPGVNPDDPYTYTLPNGPGGADATTTGTQSENPANYVGWTSRNFRILDADRGDIESLYSSGTKTRNVIRSTGITWQGYLWNDDIVPVFGWRRDKVTNASTQAPKDANDVALMDYDVDTSDANTREADGESTSWGVVVHTPRKLREKLPGGIGLSLLANRSENFKADAPRGDIFGNQIDNPIGKTKEYGFVLSTREDRLSLKVNWYETSVQNASLQADSAGFSGSLYYVWALPYWGATHALAALDGISNPQLRQGSWGWPWNGIATNADGTPDNARIEAIVRDFFTNFPLDQRFVDQYGLAMDVARMNAAGTGTFADMFASVSSYGLNTDGVHDTVGGRGASALGLQPAYSGNLRDFGARPVASVDTTSKGVEIELVAQPLRNWNLTANASRTRASRTAISSTIDQWIATYTNFLAGDAGLIRIWGGDTARTVWETQVLAPYTALKSQIGSQAPEIAPWRFNLASTYRFDSGALKGVHFGGAYRWEDRRILGYQYDAATDALDITRPWYGPSNDHIDLWVGYQRHFGEKLKWQVQLNVRNAGEKASLVPVNIQPNGDVALSRIQDGALWQLTNTFSF